MVLYYAFGGGLGHLTRANAVLYTFGYQHDAFFVLTSSDYASLIFDDKNIIKIPEELYFKPRELKSRIESIIIEQKIDIFFIDSFPAGIKGELSDLKLNNCKVRYIARLLNWTNYSSLINNFAISIDSSFIIEKLPDQQLSFIIKYSKSHQFLELKYPPSDSAAQAERVLSKIESPVWLILHSGNTEELNELCIYAKELSEFENAKPNFLIISQTDKIHFNQFSLHLNYYPASDFFPYVNKIFTACGFNCMTQTIQYADKHYFIPFDRRFDDQFVRSKNRKLSNKSLKI